MKGREKIPARGRDYLCVCVCIGLRCLDFVSLQNFKTKPTFQRYLNPSNIDSEATLELNHPEIIKKKQK